MKAISLINIALILFILAMLSGCAKQNAGDIHPITKSIHTPIPDEFANLVTFSESEIDGWKLSAPVKIYDKKTIFDYIDGAAELYLAYDFSKVATAEYRNGKTAILIDVYDMVTPENAFGIYSINRYQEANYIDIGNEAILADANLDFWKGNFYCKIYSLDQSEEYQKIVLDLGRKLALKIKEDGEEPLIIKGLPKDSLIPRTEKFFTRKLGLDNVHFISEENVLDLDGNTKGVSAEYQSDNNRFYLFIIEYPSIEKASIAFEMYLKYLNDKGSVAPIINNIDEKTGIFKLDNKYTYVKINGKTISGIWDAESTEIVKFALKIMDKKL